MAKHVSPFTSLTGAEKQIRWLEYQSIRLPYVNTDCEDIAEDTKRDENAVEHAIEKTLPNIQERPQLTKPTAYQIEFRKTRHSQYDAVIRRMKQADARARHYQSSM